MVEEWRSDTLKLGRKPMIDLFAEFVPDSTSLSAEAVRRAGFGAAPFPEVAGDDEILRVGECVRAVSATLWAYEHGRPAECFQQLSLSDAARLCFEKGHSHTLLSFDDRDLLIWQPDDHEYFVIFGNRQMLDAVSRSGIFTYSFDEYKNEPFFAGKRADFLHAVGERYTITSGKSAGSSDA